MIGKKHILKFNKVYSFEFPRSRVDGDSGENTTHGKLRSHGTLNVCQPVSVEITDTFRSVGKRASFKMSTSNGTGNRFIVGTPLKYVTVI